jgi:hypothetical protein
VKAAFHYGVLMALVAQLALAGCASSGGSGRKLQVGEEKSFDGLLEVTNSKASKAWVRPGFDLSGYTQVRLVGAGIAFQPPNERSRSSRLSSDSYPMSQVAQARLAGIVREAFEKELARSERFELTEEVGPDVLTVWGGLLDVVSFVPPQRGGRDDIYLKRIGEATLVIELRDSQSNATLMRIMDRRAVERMGGGRMSSNPVTNSGDVRRLASSWARLFRQRLDELTAQSDTTESR